MVLPSPEPVPQQPGYHAYRSPYGPSYKIQPNIHGFTARQAVRLGLTAASFGTVAGIFALFFFNEVPKVRTGIMQKLPLIGDHFRRDIPPSDNPF